MSLDTAAIQARLDAATPDRLGGLATEIRRVLLNRRTPGENITLSLHEDHAGTICESLASAAHAPTDIAALLKKVERLEGVVKVQGEAIQEALTGGWCLKIGTFHKLRKAKAVATTPKEPSDADI